MHSDHGCIHEVARRAFGFLERKYGFALAEGDCNRIRFVSSRAFVEVLYDPSRSFELAVEIGKVGDAGAPYNFAEFLGAFGVDGQSDLRVVQAGDVAVACKFVERFGEVLHRHGDEILRGLGTAFDRLQAQRDRDCHSYELERRLERGIRQAENAWKTRDYSGVVNALSPIETALSTAQRKKLNIARKRSLY